MKSIKLQISNLLSRFDFTIWCYNIINFDVKCGNKNRSTLLYRTNDIVKRDLAKLNSDPQNLILYMLHRLGLIPYYFLRHLKVLAYNIFNLFIYCIHKRRTLLNSYWLNSISTKDLKIFILEILLAAVVQSRNQYILIFCCHAPSVSFFFWADERIYRPHRPCFFLLSDLSQPVSSRAENKLRRPAQPSVPIVSLPFGAYQYIIDQYQRSSGAVPQFESFNIVRYAGACFTCKSA